MLHSCAADMQTHDFGGAAVTDPSGFDSGVDEMHDYDQENDAHHVIQPHTDTDEVSTDTDEG